MGNKIKVTRDVDIKTLKAKYKSAKTPQVKERILMILHVFSGKSARETAKIVFVDKNTVSLWVHRFNEEGFDGLRDRYRSGRPRKVDYHDLRNALDNPPSESGYKHQAWHPKLVFHYLKHQQKVDISFSYVYQLINRLGYKLKVPRTKSYKSDPEEVAAFKLRMKPVIKDYPVTHIAAVDECSVQLVTIRRKIIASRGSRPEILTQKKWKGITVIGAVTGTGKLIIKIQDHATKEKCFKIFLKYFKQKFSRGRVHLVLDNASFHTRTKVKNLAKRLSISLHYQPKHSPFINAAEEIWKQLKEFLRGILFTTLDELREGINEFFELNPTLNIKVVRYLS